jgi:anaerobic selenocysteine-containing dehydrogenase
MVVKPGAEPIVLAGILNALNAKGAPKVEVEAAAHAAGLSERDLSAIANDLKEQDKVVVMVSSRLGDSASAYLTGKLAAQLAEKLGGRYAPFFRGGNAIGAFGRVDSRVTVPQVLEGVSQGTIKGLLVFGPDLLQLYPGAVSSDELESLEVLAASAIFENDTTKHSDVGLPQAVWTEMSGTYSGSIGASTELSPLTRPQGDARPVREMLAEIAEEMGIQFAAGTADASHPELEMDVQEELDRLAARPVDEGVVLIENIHPLHRWDGTITGRMSFPRIVNPYCEVWIGEEVADSLGVDSGTNVALATDRGETSIIATVTDRMPGGLVAIPSYVPDVRGLMTWKTNSATQWFDVAAAGAKLTPES